MGVSLPHPEVLAVDWVPPVPAIHRTQLERLVAWLGEPFPPTRPPYAACVTAPRGGGSSTVARLAARRVLEAVRREGIGRSPRLLVARVREHRGAHGVATALLRGVDASFVGKGFPVAQIVAGIIRRLAREDSPTVVVLDDCGRSLSTLAPVLRGFLYPKRFLPEGADQAPPLWVVVAGIPEVREFCIRFGDCDALRTQYLQLDPPSQSELERVIDDRTRRARGGPPPEGFASVLAGRAFASGFGCARAIELLRRELLGPETPSGPYRGSAIVESLSVEPHVVRAIEAATREHPAPVGEVRAWEQHFARLEGERALPATTLWRRLVQLEAAGFVRRSVRIGGSGGTRSELTVVRPLDAVPRTGVNSPRAVALPAKWIPKRFAPEGETSGWAEPPRSLAREAFDSDGVGDGPAPQESEN